MPEVIIEPGGVRIRQVCIPEIELRHCPGKRVRRGTNVVPVSLGLPLGGTRSSKAFNF